MNMFKTLLLLLPAVILVSATEEFRKLELIQNPGGLYARTFEQSVKKVDTLDDIGVYLYEVNSNMDLLYLARTFYWSAAIPENGFWLGHKHDPDKGWVNLSDNKTNLYLNADEKLKNPKCPECCLLFRIGRNNERKFKPLIELSNCNKQYYVTYSFLRTEKTFGDQLMENMKTWTSDDKLQKTKERSVPQKTNETSVPTRRK